MRQQDITRLEALRDHLLSGGLPDLGKPHSKAGYRYAIGMADYGGGKVGVWRENLGHELCLAQHRAAAMASLWIFRVSNYPDDPKPLNRERSRQWAWDEADKVLRRDAKKRLTLELSQLDASKLAGVKLSESAPLLTKASAKPTTETLTLHGLADAWLAHLRKRIASGDVSDSYTYRAVGTVKRLKEWVADIDLPSLTKTMLDDIRIAFQTRSVRGTPRKRGTITTELGHVQSLLQWASDSDLWQPAGDWQRRLQATYRSDEHDEDADVSKRVKTYTIDELSSIYGAASPSCRLWMLLALNFGWGQSEIATARKKHFKLDKQRVARFRHKRESNVPPVPGRWKAWDETWQAALARMSDTTDDEKINPKALAFLTVADQPLVRYKQGPTCVRRYDAVSEAFETACANAGVASKGFYALRRTAINAIKRIAGAETADLFCQHVPESMTGRHYTDPEWKRLWKALRRLRRKLQPMFDAATVSKELQPA